MRANIEKQGVILDKIREYERLLPVVGRIAIIEHGNELRLDKIDAFYRGVKETREEQIANRSFTITGQEADRLVKVLHSRDNTYVRYYALHAEANELGTEQVEREFMASPRLRDHYVAELGTAMAGIYKSFMNDPVALHAAYADSACTPSAVVLK